MTRRLWDAGNSPPFCHAGNLTTVAEAIIMHGSEACTERDRYVELTYDEQLAIVDFLRTLQVVAAD